MNRGFGLFTVGLLAACWTGKDTVPETPKPPEPSTPSVKPTGVERRAIVRIDGAPGGKKFQGVWLELGDVHFVVDYRARQLWKWFADREVLVTGGCYRPFGQAINAPHFEVEHLRIAEPRRGVGPYFSIGPEEWLTGEFVDVAAPAGSKLAGSTRAMFRTGAGNEYPVLGEKLPGAGTPARVRARKLEPDMSYVARSGGPDLWVVDAVGVRSEEDPAHARTPVPCPDGS
jgi:hypothetical protein